MKQPNFNNATKPPFNRITSSLILIGFTSGFLLTGCTSMNSREDSIEAILAKENTVIEKLKMERAQPEISKAVQQNDNLKKAEAHLNHAIR